MATTTKRPLKVQPGLTASSFTQRGTGRQIDTIDDPQLGPDTNYQYPPRYPPSARRYGTSVQTPLPPGTYNVVIPRRRSQQNQRISNHSLSMKQNSSEAASTGLCMLE